MVDGPRGRDQGNVFNKFHCLWFHGWFLDVLHVGGGGYVCNRFNCITRVTSPAGDGSNPSGAKHIWYQMPPKKICKLDYLKLTIKGRFQWAYLKNDSRLSIVFKWRDEIIHLKRLIKECIASGHPLIKTPSWVLYSLCELGQNRTILIYYVS